MRGEHLFLGKAQRSLPGPSPRSSSTRALDESYAIAALLAPQSPGQHYSQKSSVRTGARRSFFPSINHSVKSPPSIGPSLITTQDWFKFTGVHPPPYPPAWHGILRKMQRQAVFAQFLDIVASSPVTGSAAHCLRCRSSSKLRNQLVSLIPYCDAPTSMLPNRHLRTKLARASLTPFSSYSILAFLALAPSRLTLLPVASEEWSITIQAGRSIGQRLWWLS
jgi:hypothetical protein